MKRSSVDLGDLVSSHSGRQLNRHDAWWILLASICFFLPFGYSIWLFYWSYTKFGLAAAFHRVEPWLLIAYLAFLCMATLLIYRIMSARRFVSVYQKGLRWRLKGFRNRSIAWDEMDGIASAMIQKKFFSKTLSLESQAILYPKEGSPLVLDQQLQDLEGLITQIKELFYPFIFPSLMDRFQGGREVQFGPISIQNHSIHIVRKVSDEEFLPTPYIPKRMHTVAWSQLLGLTVHSGFLVVQSGNSMIKRIPISQIPNFEILLKIIEQGVKT